VSHNHPQRVLCSDPRHSAIDYVSSGHGSAAASRTRNAIALVHMQSHAFTCAMKAENRRKREFCWSTCNYTSRTMATQIALPCIDR